MTEHRYHFTLTEAQATAIIELSTNSAFKTNHPFGRAGVELDEQMANQDRKWEICPKCAGTGWVEDDD